MNETQTQPTAGADGYVKVEGKVGEDIPAVPFVGVAYGFIFTALLVYVLNVARGLGRVRRDIADLRKRVDARLGAGPT